MDQFNSQLLGALGLSGHFLQKLPLPLQGSSPPHNTLFLGPSPLLITNSILICSAVFVLVPNAMLYNALSIGKKTPKIARSPLGFRHPAGGGPSHSHRKHAQKFGKQNARGS